MAKRVSVFLTYHIGYGDDLRHNPKYHTELSPWLKLNSFPTACITICIKPWTSLLQDATEEAEDKEDEEENILSRSQHLEVKEDLQDEEKEEEAGLSTSFCREISERCKEKFSIKSRVEGLYVKKKSEDLAWRNFIRYYFKENPGYQLTCCKKSYQIANSFITHVFRHHDPKSLLTA